MGVVWAAEQTDPIRRAVALKVVRPGVSSPAAVERFVAERQALALMDHPNIARVLDAGCSADGHPYVAMELVPGGPITEFCEVRRLGLRERLDLFVAVCRAVQHAHHKGVIHRDLKPSNVLVCLQDGRPVPKVIDFGIAKLLAPPAGRRATATGFVGTPEYMAPEQAGPNPADVDTRADVYALGVLLYELLTGSPPHGRPATPDVAEWFRRVREEVPDRPSARIGNGRTTPLPGDPGRVARAVQGELDWVVMKALEKDRDRRYATANELAADLGRFLRDEPVAARPPRLSYRARKFVRRHRGPVAAAALAALALVAAAVASTVAMTAARDAERVADAARESATRDREFALAQRDVARQRTEEAERAAAEAADAATDLRLTLQFVQDRVFAAAQPDDDPPGQGRDVTVR
jgi:serine/threonine protein kinase